ncbi:3613_t:CDS:1, partial [Gigaspora margarita]
LANFIESGFEVYTNRELVEIDLSRKTEAKKAAEKQYLIVNKLI